MLRVCASCGSQFVAKYVFQRHCSRACYKAHYNIARIKPDHLLKRKRAAMRTEDVPRDLLESLYEEGKTQTRIAAILGCSNTPVQKAMKLYGIPRRSKGCGAKKGPDNYIWKGDKASYKALHLRVYTARGSPSVCEHCGIVDSPTGYDWANLTGNYADVNDYARLCKRCHFKFDGRGRHLHKPRTKTFDVTCLTCGTQFQSTAYNSKFCSKACFRQDLNKRKRRIYYEQVLSLRPSPEVKCLQCGTAFIKKKKTEKFCCGKCQVKNLIHRRLLARQAARGQSA